MKQHVLGDRLFAFQWIGVFWNVVSVFLVGGTAILNESERAQDDEASGEALLGVLLVMAGALVQAMQFVFEEKVMTMVSLSKQGPESMCFAAHTLLLPLRTFRLPPFFLLEWKVSGVHFYA